MVCNIHNGALLCFVPPSKTGSTKPNARRALERLLSALEPRARTQTLLTSCTILLSFQTIFAMQK